MILSGLPKKSEHTAKMIAKSNLILEKLCEFASNEQNKPIMDWRQVETSTQHDVVRPNDGHMSSEQWMLHPIFLHFCDFLRSSLAFGAQLTLPQQKYCVRTERSRNVLCLFVRWTDNCKSQYSMCTFVSSDAQCPLVPYTVATTTGKYEIIKKKSF